MRPLLFAPTSGLVVLFAALLTAGCAANACTRVRDDRREFQQRRGAGDKAQLVVAIPATTLDQALSLPLARLAPIAVPLPELGLPIPGLDVGLGKLEVALRSVSVQPAPPGQLGLRVRFVLLSRGATITAIDLEAVIAPQLTPGDATVRLSLRAQDLVRVPLKSTTLTNPVEALTIQLIPSNQGAKGELRFAWGTLAHSVEWSAK